MAVKKIVKFTKEEIKDGWNVIYISGIGAFMCDYLEVEDMGNGKFDCTAHGAFVPEEDVRSKLISQGTMKSSEDEVKAVLKFMSSMTSERERKLVGTAKGYIMPVWDYWMIRTETREISEITPDMALHYEQTL
jgi:hypothetical protein